jgi:hypothetical protein
MAMITKQTEIALWHYVCPECGVGNIETGYHAPAYMIYCEICLEDAQHVKLKRWPVEHDSSTPSSDGLGGT